MSPRATAGARLVRALPGVRPDADGRAGLFRFRKEQSSIAMRCGIPALDLETGAMLLENKSVSKNLFVLDHTLNLRLVRGEISKDSLCFETNPPKHHRASRTQDSAKKPLH